MPSIAVRVTLLAFALILIWLAFRLLEVWMAQMLESLQTHFVVLSALLCGTWVLGAAAFQRAA